MFRVFQEEKLITSCMFAFLGGSILLRVFLGLLYRNMIKEADNMATTKNRLLKQCKTKFASCYQLGNGVANIPVFVDKFLNRMTLGRLSFETIYHLSGQLMLLSVVCSGVGVCKCIIEGRTVGEVLPFYIVSFFGLYAYFSISTVVDVRGKKRVLKVNLVDYLENHLSPRIEVTRQDMEMLYGEAVYEEKQLPYGRVQGGKKGRGRNRKGAKAVQARPERRRTVELMPIESRMAAGGEPFRGGMPAEQVYTGRQQIRRQEEPQFMGAAHPEGVWQLGQAEENQPMKTQQPEARLQTTHEQEGERFPGAPQPEGILQTMHEQEGERFPGAPQPEGTVQPAREQEGGRFLGAQQPGGTVQPAHEQEGERFLGTPQCRTEQPVRSEDMRQPSGCGQAWWTEEGEQAYRMAPGSRTESPEDSAAVTEEELEALLKEFLTT